jgi:hypothetical protein
MCEPLFETRHKEVSFCLVDLYAFVVSFLAHAHESYAPTSKRLATLNMPTTDIYARCNFTRSGHPNIRFNVIIKVPKAKLEELRQLPENRDQTDNQLLGGLAGKVITIVYPEPSATFVVGCERYPEGAIPTEVKERPEGTKIDELTFWSM